MIHKDTRLIVFITLSFIIPLFTNAQSWGQMENDYDSFLKNKQNDLAVSKAREMNSWAMKSEGDTSIFLPISLKLIGNAFENSDSAIFYYDSALNVLEKQNRKYHIQSAKLHYNKSLRYSKEKNINLSILESDEAISILDKLENPEYPFCIRVLNNAGIFCRDLKKYTESEFYFKKSLELTALIVGKEHADYAGSLNNLGNLYFNMGNYKAAEPYYKQALVIFKKALGEEHPDYTMSLNNLGILYWNMGDYKAAEPCYKQALDIYKKALGEEDPDYAMSLNNLGSLYFNMGDYKAAERYCKQALDVYKKAYGEEHPDYAGSLITLGLFYYTKGDYKAAEPYYKHALVIYKGALGEKHPDYAMNLNKLGNLYYNMGDYKAAEPYYKQALVIYKRALGEEHPDYAMSLNNLGLLYADLGDCKAAEPYYKQALESRKKALGEEHPDYAASLNNLGNLYSDMGDYKAAEPYYKQALDIYKKAFGEEDPYYAMSLNNLGNLFSDMGDYNAAELYYKQALVIRKKALGEEHPDYAASLNNLGILFSFMGDYKAAEPYYKQALVIGKKALGEEHPDYANSLNNLGSMYMNMGDYKAAEPYLKQALDVYKKAFGEEHSYYAKALNNLGHLYSDMGDYKLAESFFIKDLNVRLGNLSTNFSWLSAKEKEAYWLKEKAYYNYLISFSNKVMDEVPSSTSLSYKANLISKSLLLETSRELDQAIAKSSDEEMKSQLKEMKQLRKLNITVQSEGSAVKKEMDHYKSQADSLDKILVNKLGEYAASKRKFEITWKDVQANLTSADAAIEFARYYDFKDSIYKYMALVVRPEYEYPKLVKIGSEVNIKNASSQKEFSELYNYVWRGVDSLLLGVKTIYYSPVGELNNISFSALISDVKTSNQIDTNQSNWSYLMDRYELHQLTTTRYLADETLKTNKPLPLSIKLVGGVNYSEIPLVKDSINQEESNEDFALQINLQNEVNNSKLNRGGKINYLKGSEIEVKEISKTLKNSGWETTISDGNNAGEYQFKRELKEKSPGIIHISTHGFAFPEKETKEEKGLQMNEITTYKVSEDPMVRCGLMFSGANISWNGDSKKMIETSGDDGILTAAEVANLDLSNTKLVVLSACETGLGKIESSEGTFGLKRGFKLAGVDQIIVSLWKVPDNETMELMTLFYSDLSISKNIDSSFKKAQKEMRNRYPYDPEKWAGFVLVR